MYILKKIGVIILILSMAYFTVGLLACIGVIVIEATTHQMTIEMADDNVQPWLIYLGMGVMMLLCFGLGALCYTGYYYLRKSMRKEKALTSADS